MSLVLARYLCATTTCIPCLYHVPVKVEDAEFPTDNVGGKGPVGPQPADHLGEYTLPS